MITICVYRFHKEMASITTKLAVKVKKRITKSDKRPKLSIVLGRVIPVDEE